MNLQKLFKLRGSLDKKTGGVIFFIGLLLLFSLWQAITVLFKIPPSILPSPFAVLASFPELHFENELVRNSMYSLSLNVVGYVEACLIAIPLGITIGLFPAVRALLGKYIEASRFIPLAATTGLFIIWFGIYHNMKVQFLAVSIIVYLLPVVIQRVDEVAKVHEDTAFTLGANMRQMITTVYLPSVMSRILDDIRVLVGISWTYITIVECLNMTGGIGALAFKAARQSRPDKVFAVLLVVIVIGLVQDKVFKWMDRKLFPFKYI